MRKLAIFDFDGTLTTRDSLIEFLKFYKGEPKFLLGMLLLSPLLVAYKLKLIPNWKAKQNVLRYFIGGSDLDHFNEQCIKFAKQKLPGFLRFEAIEKLNWHKSKGHYVIVISASPENWLRPWTIEEGLQLIATKLEVKEGKIPGFFNGKNCYGKEKLARLKAEINLDDFDAIYAYGDSRGDKEILEIATDKFFRKF